jgi:hypothetical protein
MMGEAFNWTICSSGVAPVVGISAKGLWEETRAIALRCAKGMLVVLIEAGLPDSRGAAVCDAAVGAIERARDMSLDAVLSLAHRTLLGSYGASVALARVNELDACVELAAVGTVAVDLVTDTSFDRLQVAGGLLGVHFPRVVAHHASFGPGDAIVLRTCGEGVSSDVWPVSALDPQGAAEQILGESQSAACAVIRGAHRRG